MKFEGTVSFLVPDGQYITVEANDIDDAEFQMLERVKEDVPDAQQVFVEMIKEIDLKEIK